MRSEFESALDDWAMRTVSCFVPLDPQNREISNERQVTNITFTVKYGDNATRIYLRSSEEKPSKGELQGATADGLSVDLEG
ncbi:hypothetical protein V5799_009921 [Amblyomma americanum]|uniref:Uncharacterized protein n=1 Tax=Amblyomma americanum TaxID=6943 RepID=A0AAQ4FAM1_AMBAM